ncbi:hypothetical protein DMJ13_25785 [halophilic archaeon]|nr:hypothetical protein DMJ13_25785 [halophilic archaeon]
MTRWFDGKADHSGPSTPTQYSLSESYTMNASQSPTHGVVDAVLDATESIDGQTTLPLYNHLDPDALETLITASTDKQSHVEVRFTINEYLIVVRSTGDIFVYEPLTA